VSKTAVPFLIPFLQEKLLMFQYLAPVAAIGLGGAHAGGLSVTKSIPGTYVYMQQNPTNLFDGCPIPEARRAGGPLSVNVISIQ
jgi:hypothetical protein